ncbi:MAG: hypothetical protein GY772_06355, partial [bacterium]|nr:hypothetical protein [bacterium]
MTTAPKIEANMRYAVDAWERGDPVHVVSALRRTGCRILAMAAPLETLAVYRDALARGDTATIDLRMLAVNFTSTLARASSARVQPDIREMYAELAQGSADLLDETLEELKHLTTFLLRRRGLFEVELRMALDAARTAYPNTWLPLSPRMLDTPTIGFPADALQALIPPDAERV